MKKLIIFSLYFVMPLVACCQAKTIHVFVALCDNEFQGIVPVPAKLGDGKVPNSNLYWGAAYGIKNYFKNKSTDWILVNSSIPDNPLILERVLFKHKTKEVYLLADAYDGEQIKQCTKDFLQAANSQNEVNIFIQNEKLNFGGCSDLVAYIGHDGLMEFDVNLSYIKDVEQDIDLIILACYSQEFFQAEILKTGQPI